MEFCFVSYPYLVLLSLFSINSHKGRRAITVHEFEHFRDSFFEECRKSGIECSSDADEFYTKYYDYIKLSDGTFTYRLKPIFSKEDIAEHIHSLGILKILNNKRIVEDLNDMTLEEENNREEFKRVDEKHQLKKMYELLRLSQELAKKEEELGVIKGRSISLASEETVEAIFEEKPFISFEELESSYSKRI